MHVSLPLTLTAGLALAVSVIASPPTLPRSTPEAQGISSVAIQRFLTAAEAIDGLHSFMLVRHGHVVAEGWWAPYRAEAPHTFYSLTKSFTSTAVGFAIAEGRMSLDDQVLSFFPDAAPAKPSDHLQGMRVRDLLAMSTGHHADVIDDFFNAGLQDLPRAFLALPVAHKPGTHFVYNTPASQMLSEIVQKVTGEKLADYLRPRLLEPLGISAPHWAETTDGVSLGGFGMAARTEDIARFGQFYLQKGKWQGRSLLPEAWIEAATARQTSNGSAPTSDWDQGYGYQFWRSRHGLYRGDGAFGQYCIVLDQADAVIAITSGVRDMQAVMNLAWEHLLPAMEPQALAADPAAVQSLRASLEQLALPTPTGERTSTLAAEVSGRTYRLADNPLGLSTVRVDFSPTETAVTVAQGGEAHRLPAGFQTWTSTRTALFPQLSHDPARFPEQPAAVAGAWTAPDEYTMQVCLTETPFAVTYRLRFAGEELTIEGEQNVAFGDRMLPTLHGRRQ